MRHVVLSDDGYNVAPDASHRLLAVCFFPESPKDQEQGRFVARMEQEDFLHGGADAYEPSEITTAINNLIEKRSGQLYAVGFIALAYFWLAHTPYKPSLNRASIIASYSAAEFGKIIWRSGLKRDATDRSTQVTDDPSTLERIFRKYRSVAHICAARVTAAAYLDDLHVWDEAPLVTNTLIQTAVTFQDSLEKVTETSTWNIWDLKRHYPSALSGTPVFLPDDNLLTWIARGYESAISQGLIVNPDARGR